MLLIKDGIRLYSLLTIVAFLLIGIRHPGIHCQSGSEAFLPDRFQSLNQRDCSWALEELQRFFSTQTSFKEWSRRLSTFRLVSEDLLPDFENVFITIIRRPNLHWALRNRFQNELLKHWKSHISNVFPRWAPSCYWAINSWTCWFGCKSSVRSTSADPPRKTANGKVRKKKMPKARSSSSSIVSRQSGVHNNSLSPEHLLVWIIYLHRFLVCHPPVWTGIGGIFHRLPCTNKRWTNR